VPVPSLLGARVCIVGAFSILAVACASGPRARVATATREGRLEDALSAYEDLAALEGDDVGLLVELAMTMLSRSACADDEAEAQLAVRELAGTGTPGRERLSEVARRGCTGSFDATVLLARRGDPTSRSYLRGLADSPEPRVRTAVVIALSPPEDRELMLRWAGDEDDAVRAAAAERLGALGPDDADALALLTELVRSDGNAPVRARAARALGSFEAAAFEPLRDRLSDPEGSVRMAAIEALVRADRARARGTLLDLLATPTSSDTIEAARILTTLVGGPSEAPSDDDRTAALAHLRAALSSSEPTLRAQTAVALVGIPGEDDLLPALVQALSVEHDPTASLSLGRAILRRDEHDATAVQALRGLLGAEGMTAVQAAVELAVRGDVTGLEAIRAFAHGGTTDVGVRSVAMHALGRRNATELFPLLRDAEATVRLAAAGAIAGALR
jgi:HEAT repeat protein